MVDEQQIADSWQQIKKSGVYVEPTSAAAYAGLSQYLQKHTASKELIVSAFTGHGLKK